MTDSHGWSIGLAVFLRDVTCLILHLLTLSTELVKLRYAMRKLSPSSASLCKYSGHRRVQQRSVTYRVLDKSWKAVRLLRRKSWSFAEGCNDTKCYDFCSERVLDTHRFHFARRAPSGERWRSYRRRPPLIFFHLRLAFPLCIWQHFCTLTGHRRSFQPQPGVRTSIMSTHEKQQGFIHSWPSANCCSLRKWTKLLTRVAIARLYIALFVIDVVPLQVITRGI
jgi:hypothetical protein